MYVSLGSNFFHAGTPLPGGRMLQRLGALMEVQVWPRYVSPKRVGNQIRVNLDAGKIVDFRHQQVATVSERDIVKG